MEQLHNKAELHHCAMQVRVRQLVSTAAVATVALIRFLQAFTSSSDAQQRDVSAYCASKHPVHSMLTRPKSTSLALKIGKVFSKCYTCLFFIVPRTCYAQRRSKTPHDSRRLLAEPIPLPDELLKESLALLTLASQGTPLHPCSPPAPVSDRVSQQVACISRHMRASPPREIPLVNNTPGTLDNSNEERKCDAQAMEEGSLSNSVAALVKSHLFEQETVSQPRAMLRTMLACEGIAINSLFDHGVPTSRV
jgi:hypothetical protein